MARGQILKKEIAQKILNTFEGSFLYNDGKEIRIPGMEEGELIQIKVALTAAKENVAQGDDNVVPGEQIITTSVTSEPTFNQTETKTVEPTPEEKANVRDLLEALGL